MAHICAFSFHETCRFKRHGLEHPTNRTTRITATATTATTRRRRRPCGWNKREEDREEHEQQLAKRHVVEEMKDRRGKEERSLSWRWDTATNGVGRRGEGREGGICVRTCVWVGGQKAKERIENSALILQESPFVRLCCYFSPRLIQN